MTAACDYCTLAQARPDCSSYRAGCRACGVRELASGPLFHASGLYGGTSANYRKALSGIFGDDWQKGHEQVKAAAKRVHEWRAAA